MRYWVIYRLGPGISYVVQEPPEHLWVLHEAAGAAALELPPDTEKLVELNTR